MAKLKKKLTSHKRPLIQNTQIFPVKQPLVIAWENSRHLAMLPLVPRHMTSEKRARKFHTDDVSLPDLGSASDWLNQISHAARPIRSTIQIWVVTRHQYGISALVSQTSIGGKTSGSVAKCRLFSQATFHMWPRPLSFLFYFPLFLTSCKQHGTPHLYIP